MLYEIKEFFCTDVFSIKDHLKTLEYFGSCVKPRLHVRFYLVIFFNCQQSLKILRVATHKRAIRKSGKIVKVDRDDFNKLNISQRVEEIIIRVAASTEKQDTTNRYLANEMRE